MCVVAVRIEYRLYGDGLGQHKVEGSNCTKRKLINNFFFLGGGVETPYLLSQFVPYKIKLSSL